MTNIACGGCGMPLGHVDDACPNCLPNFYSKTAHLVASPPRPDATSGRVDLQPNAWAKAAFDALQPDDELDVAWLADQFQEYGKALRATVARLEGENEQLRRQVDPTTMQECQEAQARLNARIAVVVLGDPAQSVGLSSSVRP